MGEDELNAIVGHSRSRGAGRITCYSYGVHWLQSGITGLQKLGTSGRSLGAPLRQMPVSRERWLADPQKHCAD
jgi:hypothetical protein